jgi:tetratricopeptide (TPR) repeat protein
MSIAPIDEILPALSGSLGVPQTEIPRDTLRRWMSDMGGHVSLALTLARASDGFVLGAEVRGLEKDSLLFSEQLAANGAEDLTRVADRIATNTQRVLAASVGKLGMQQPTGAFFNTSADAARLMVEGGRAFADRNFLVAAERYRDAVRIDSTFAIAWEMLAFSLGNAGVNVDERLRARAASFRHRDKVRLLPERLGIEAEYYRSIGDPARAMAVFERLEREYGSNFSRVNGLGLVYAQARRFDDARRAFDRARDSTGRYPNFANQNYVMALVDLGRLDDAKREVRLLDSLLGFDHPSTMRARYHVLIADRNVDSVAVLARRQMDAARTPAARLAASTVLRDALMTRGELLASERVDRGRGDEVGRVGATGAQLSNDLAHVFRWMQLTDDTAAAVQVLDEALSRTPLASLAPMDRPYANAIRALGAVGRFDEARALAVEWSAEIPDEFKPAYGASLQNALGEMELRANRPRIALEHFRRSDAGSCVACLYPDYARAWDAAGNADSALFWYERFINAKSARLLENDALFLAQAYRRAGELHEARGDLATAMQRYTSFVSLWKDADASLQPFVASTAAKLERLRAARR